MKTSLLGALLLLTAWSAQAQSRIDLQDALMRVRDVASRSRIDEAGGMEARALRAAHAGWEAPTVFLAREGMAGTDFEEQRLGVRLGIRPWPYDRALRRSADALLNASRADERTARNVREAQLREAWALWGLAHEELRLRERQMALADSLSRIVERRIARGDAAEVDALRLTGLRSGTRTRLAEARMAVESQRAALRALLYLTDAQGAVLEAPDSITYRLPVQAGGVLPEHESLAARREALARERTAYASLWLPALELESFVQHFETGPVRYGIQAGLRLAWPISPESRAQRLDAHARWIRTEHALATEEVNLQEDVAMLTAVVPEIDTELYALRTTARPRANALVAQMTLGYASGALPLRDVLEAQQAREDVEEGWISLQRLMVRHLAHWQARTGEVLLFPETP